jgi:hypothetical protein
MGSVTRDVDPAELRREMREGMPELVEATSDLFGLPVRVTSHQINKMADDTTDTFLDFVHRVGEIDEQADWQSQLDAALEALYELSKRSLPDVPRGRELLRYFARIARRTVTPAQEFDRAPWHLSRRQYAYHQFIANLVVRDGMEMVETVWKSWNPGLLPQIQNMMSLLSRRGQPLKELRRPLESRFVASLRSGLAAWRQRLDSVEDWAFVPIRLRRTVEKWLYPTWIERACTRHHSNRLREQLDALKTIVVDWERWTIMPYCLLQLEQGQQMLFDEGSATSLPQRIRALQAHPLLAGLVEDGPEWRTIRNAISHGKMRLVPAQGLVRFQDINDVLDVPEAQVADLAIDMWLSNFMVYLTMAFVLDTRYQQGLAVLGMTL